MSAPRRLLKTQLAFVGMLVASVVVWLPLVAALLGRRARE